MARDPPHGLEDARIADPAPANLGLDHPRAPHGELII
jgi:hypothetical protein